MNAVLGIGFKKVSYNVSEGKVIFTFEVESNGSSALPIDFTVNVTKGDACSEYLSYQE